MALNNRQFCRIEGCNENRKTNTKPLLGTLKNKTFCEVKVAARAVIWPQNWIMNISAKNLCLSPLQCEEVFYHTDKKLLPEFRPGMHVSTYSKHVCPPRQKLCWSECKKRGNRGHTISTHLPRMSSGARRYCSASSSLLLLLI